MAAETYDEKDLFPGGGGNFDSPLPPVANEDEEPEPESENRLGFLLVRIRQIGSVPLGAYLGEDKANAYRILNSLEEPEAANWYN